MLATFHWTWGDGAEGSEMCRDLDDVEMHVDKSREGLAYGSEVCFYIEWHAQEERC